MKQHVTEIWLVRQQPLVSRWVDEGADPVSWRTTLVAYGREALRASVCQGPAQGVASRGPERGVPQACAGVLQAVRACMHMWSCSVVVVMFG